jgi:hypothetical protein
MLRCSTKTLNLPLTPEKLDKVTSELGNIILLLLKAII